MDSVKVPPGDTFLSSSYGFSTRSLGHLGISVTAKQAEGHSFLFMGREEPDYRKVHDLNVRAAQELLGRGDPEAAIDTLQVNNTLATGSVPWESTLAAALNEKAELSVKGGHLGYLEFVPSRQRNGYCLQSELADTYARALVSMKKCDDLMNNEMYRAATIQQFGLLPTQAQLFDMKQQQELVGNRLRALITDVSMVAAGRGISTSSINFAESNHQSRFTSWVRHAAAGVNSDLAKSGESLPDFWQCWAQDYTSALFDAIRSRSSVSHANAAPMPPGFYWRSTSGDVYLGTRQVPSSYQQQAQLLASAHGAVEPSFDNMKEDLERATDLLNNLEWDAALIILKKSDQVRDNDYSWQSRLGNAYFENAESRRQRGDIGHLLIDGGQLNGPEYYRLESDLADCYGHALAAYTRFINLMRFNVHREGLVANNGSNVLLTCLTDARSQARLASERIAAWIDTIADVAAGRGGTGLANQEGLSLDNAGPGVKGKILTALKTSGSFSGGFDGASKQLWRFWAGNEKERLFHKFFRQAYVAMEPEE